MTHAVLPHAQNALWDWFLSQNPDTPARTIDQEAVVITPHDSRIHALNPTATFIWDQADGTRTLTTILAELLEEFEVDAALAREDAAVFVSEGLRLGLFVMTQTPTPLVV